MRIVSGILKGRHIQPPSGFDARPTTDFAKEALFNILINQYNLADCAILDLFAGSGNISFEFCSRESNVVTAVEINPKYCNFIKECAKNFQCTNIFVVKADVYKYLNSTPHQYDIIFADPPYNSRRYEEIHDKVFERQLLKPNGVLILEHDKTINLEQLFAYKETRKYAGVLFSFFYNV